MIIGHMMNLHGELPYPLISRELNIAGIVGADNIVEILKERKRDQELRTLTIDCSEGELLLKKRKSKIQTRIFINFLSFYRSDPIFLKHHRNHNFAIWNI